MDCVCLIFEVMDVILQGMVWLGFDYDGDVISQFECVDCYVEVVLQFLVEGKVYKCFVIQEEIQVFCDKVKE